MKSNLQFLNIYSLIHWHWGAVCNAPLNEIGIEGSFAERLNADFDIIFFLKIREKKMTIKEAILKSLEERKALSTHWDILKHIQQNNYYDFKEAKTPESTISALLGDFIRRGDNRVSRIKRPENYYEYYLTAYENELDLKVDEAQVALQKTSKKDKTYYERDLHLLFSTYLKSKEIYCKTILHEQSNGSEEHQKWIHPDIIGIDFLNLKTEETEKFIKTLNTLDTFKLTSYELKKEIKSDSELKKCYFQAVSNSSWANYGYLVAFEVNSNLLTEIERLNQSFGIGIIELKANPYESKILFPSRYKDLDFKTIDKLCKINDTFKEFIVYVEEIITNKGRNYKRVKKEFQLDFCDNFFKNDTEITAYCKSKHIPIDSNE